MLGHFLDRLFSPRSVAVVGVSERAQSVGRLVFENLGAFGQKAQLFAVNPNHAEVLGVRCYPNVGSLPQPVDLAVIVVPAAKVPGVLRECGEHGVKAAIVLSAGFAEIGPSGAQLLHAALTEARRYGLRVLGPNCLGVMHAPSALNASFMRGPILHGGLALVSQSGAICSAIVDWAESRRIGFSTVVSLGAGADIGFGDVLDYLALDPQTRAILLYVEGIEHARGFMSGLRAAARMKPVIVVKAGRHPAGVRAATSHTGAIIGSDVVFDAALRRAGAVRVSSLPQLFSAAEILSRAHRIDGDRLTILTNAGGLGVLAADRASDLGVQLAKIEGAAREQLASMLPPHAAHDNPIDVLGDAAPQLYAKALEVCLDNPSSDGLLVLLTPQAMTNAEEVARAVAERSARSQKPVLACFMGGSQVERALALLTEQGVPCFDSPEAAVEAFANLGTFRRNQELLLQVPERASDRPAPDIDGARLIVEHALSQGRSLLSQLESNAVLHAFGLPTVSAVRASNADDALVAAESLGLPVALKIDTPDITHKTEVAGVRLDVRTAAMVRTAYQELVDEVRRHRPDARIQGVLVEPMVRRPGARELCIGLLRDPTFGPAVSFGAGGTLVELIRDQAVALPPLNDLLARDMIAQTKVSALLGHFRNQPAVNLDALVRALLCVSDLACELPEIKELDINPLVADAEGVMALDARIVVERVAATQRSYTHVAICPFPKHLTRHVQLSDGRNVTLRPVRPEDARMEERFVRTLSSESKYFRFMQSVVALTPAMLVRFTQIDYDREMALVAVTEESGAEIEIGVARYVENPDGRSCEFAVVVADDWHKKGIGSLLMGALIEVARNKGLLQMRGDVLSDNAGMLALMRHLGFSIEAHPQDETLMQVTLTLV